MSTLRANTISDAAGTGPATLTSQVAAKSWWQYDQTGPTIDDSYNVSSIDDDATGIFTPHFTNVMDAATYALAGTGNTAAAAVIALVAYTPATQKLAGECACITTNGTAFDVEGYGVIHGDLA